MEPKNPVERKIGEMCKRWLEGFNYVGAEIGRLELLKRSEIDRLLGLVRVRFSFRVEKETGEGVAFLEAAEVVREVPCCEVEEGMVLPA